MVLNKKGEPIVWSKIKDVFREALEKIAPRAMATMQSILDISKELNQAEYTWTLPDGFKSHYRVKKKEEYKISVQQTRTGSKYVSISFKEDVYNKDADSRGLPANIVQSIDGYVAREMIRRMDGKFITTIHDAFYCHPEHMELMRQNYKDILSEILQSDLLNDILSEILGHRTSHSKNNGLTREDIQNSDFILS